MENWRYGEITEDKKLPVRFLDSQGDPWPLGSLVGYGVKLIGENGTTLVKAGINIDGYDSSLISVKDDYTAYVTVHGSKMPTSPQYIRASTIIKITDADMPDGTFTDISEDTKLVYNFIADSYARI